MGGFSLSRHSCLPNPVSSETRRHPWLVRMADGLLRHRVLLFVAALALTVPAIGPSNRLKLDESIESFYAPDDPDLLAWLESKRAFGGDEYVMVAWKEPDLLSAERLDALAEFAGKFRDPQATPGLQHESTHDLARVLDMNDNPFIAALPRSPFNFQTLVKRILRGKLIEFSRNVLVGQDDQTTAIMTRLQPETHARVSRAETLRLVRELADAHEPPAHVAGEPVQINDMFRYVEQDSAILGWATSALLIVVILILFRSLRWVLLPLLVVHVTIIWTRALLALSGLRLSMVSSMLNSLVTIIGIAVVTHVTVTYRELRKDHDRVAAFRESFYRLAPAIFWNCATTAIGFAVLLISGIVPVQSFAIMMSIGTMIPLLTCALLLPGGILIGRLDADPRDAPAERHIVRGLLAVTRGVDRRPIPVLMVSLALLVFASLGVTRLTVQTDFSTNIRATSPVVKSLDFFEANLGGAGNWEVNFAAPATLDHAFLDKVREVGKRVRAIEMPDGTRLSKVYALTDGLDFLPDPFGTDIEHKRKVLKAFEPEFESDLYNPQLGRMRLFLRAQEQKPAEIKLALIAEVEKAAREVFPDAKVTGLYVLIARMISSLLGDQLNSFVLGTLGITLAMAIAFRSGWIGLASLVPNLIPILLVVGGMGWLGVPINLGTAMIASVSMGLTVDSSIHYLVDYRRARELGMDHAAAIRDTHAGVGRALVFSNLALMIGFTVLCLSNFIPLIYFGVLVSVAMLGGLIGNLVLLPLLLRWVPMRVG